MSRLSHRALLPVIFTSVLALLGTSSCGRLGQTDEESRVAHAFAAWKQAIIDQRTDVALTYIPGHVEDYLNRLNTAPVGNATGAPSASPSPGVDLLLRTALEKKVPAEMRAHLTLGSLMQRINERHLFHSSDVRQIDLGRVTIDGDRASAEVYYQGTLTALRLPFIKEGEAWKIDVMAILPYAEVLMRVDRAIKGETEAQQVDQLVSKLPAL